MDDLLEQLGVTLPTAQPKGVEVPLGHKPPRERAVRHTDWSNAKSFTFGGYLARVRRTECGCCDAVTRVFEGVFAEELAPNGTRRLQAVAQWPQESGLRLETVNGGKTVLCAQCVREMGFDREVMAPGAYALVIGE